MMPSTNLLGLPPKRPATAPAPAARLIQHIRPGAGAEEDAAKVAAEGAATGGATGAPAGTDPPAVADTKEAYIFLQERFGTPAFEGLTDDQVLAEAEWHRREEAGFPEDRPTPALYAEHYRLHHPGVAVPPKPPPNTRSGQLDYSSVIALGLIPLGQVAPPGDERFYEPALVTEGMPVTARNGSVYRVVYRDGRFMVQAEAGGPDASTPPGVTGSPQPGASPQPTQAPGHAPVVRTDAEVAKARRDGRIQGGVWGVLGGIALGVGVTALVVKFWPSGDAGRDDGRRLPERSNPKAKGHGTIESDTPILPYVIATTVLEEVRVFLGGKGKEALAEKLYKKERKIGAHLAARAEEVYANDERFRKSILSRADHGNAGRDQLYVWMRHWLAAYLKENEPGAYASLPQDFANGVPLPGSDKPGARPR